MCVGVGGGGGQQGSLEIDAKVILLQLPLPKYAMAGQTIYSDIFVICLGGPRQMIISNMLLPGYVSESLSGGRASLLGSM